MNRSALSKSLGFVLSTLLLFQALDWTFTYLLKRDPSLRVGWISRLGPARHDFAFLGASRVYTMVQTEVLESRWAARGVNIALDGSNLMEQYLILRHFFDQGNTVNHLFLGLDIIKLDYSMNSDFRVWCFLPYISDPPVLEELAQNFGAARAYRWRYIPFFRYAEFNSKLGPFTVANSLLGIVKAPFNERGDWTGRYTAPLPAADRASVPSYSMVPQPVQLEYLDKILALAAAHGAKVHVYTAPFYYPRYTACTNTAEILESHLLPRITAHGGDYHNFAELPIARDPEAFSDPLHMNIRGLPIFMDALANRYRREFGAAEVKVMP